MIQNLLNGTKQTISLEVFPPKKEDEFEAAFALMDKFGALKPDYISCTYGAGGSKSKKTTEICAYIQNQLHIDALAHLTCVGSTKESIGIKHILALRGDRPSYMDDETYNSREFEYASELTSYLLSKDDFIIAGGCYPEKHFEAIDMEQDLAHLKAKVDCGASFLISQLFFDNDLFILDPNTSIMINMFPETFFFDLVMLIMATYVISVCVIYFVLRVLDKKVKV